MTKKRIVALSFILATATLFILKEKEQITSAVQSMGIVPQNVTSNATKPGAGVSPQVPAAPATSNSKAEYANTPDPQWQSHLHKALKAQAGKSLKEIKIVKEKSFVYKKDDIPLHVESVLITLTNQQDASSSFRALVDSQTGKVLETWDRPIFDPADVRQGFRFKLDPRYTN